ncbi:hypothetical protein ACROYT_G015207 [Oculina patagonica]
MQSLLPVRQSHFCTNFTPPKNSVFSRQQLTTLYCKAATTIANILVEISSRTQAATLLPRQPGQRKDCSLWSLPSLFEESACFICKEGLKKSLQSLAATANQAFVNTTHDAGAVPQEDDDITEQVESSPDDGHEIPDPGEVNVDQVIQ